MSRERNPRDPNNPYRIGQKNERGQVICGAKRPNSEEKCGNFRIDKNNGRCRFHGGNSVRGVNHPMFIHGSTSKYYLPEGTHELYLDSLNNKELVTLREEIALLDARIRQLTNELKTGASDDSWKTLDDLWDDFMYAVRSGDHAKQQTLLITLNDHIKNSVEERKSWMDIERLVEKRRKLVGTEATRMKEANQFLTAEQCIAMVSAVVVAVKEAVHKYVEPKTQQYVLDAAQQKYIEIIDVKPS